MKRQRGGIEILLLLGSLVGVVAFFSLSLAFSSVLIDWETYNELVAQWEMKSSHKAELERRIHELEEERDVLGNQRDGPTSGKTVPHDENTLQTLRQRYEGLLARIEDLKETLNGMPETKRPEPGRREVLERTVNILRDEVRRTKATGSDKKHMLEEYTGPTNEILQARLDELDALLMSLKHERRLTETEMALVRSKVRYSAASGYEHPLHVECRRKSAVFHPEGEAVTPNALEIEQILRKRARGHDMVAIWVRPYSHECYWKALEQAEKTGLPISYEPVPYGESLDAVIASLRDG